MKHNVTLWVVLGSLIGTIGYILVVDQLDKAYRPFPSDMPAWILYAFPTGIILSSTTAFAVVSHLNRNYDNPGSSCIGVALVLAFCYVQMFQGTSSLWNSTYALSESGPALLWSSFLLAYGVFLTHRSSKRKSYPPESGRDV